MNTPRSDAQREAGAVSEPRGRPGGLQPLIDRWPLVSDTIINWHLENVAVPTTRFGRMFINPTAKRHAHTLKNINRVFCACLKWCQLRAGGLISVPHGSKRGSCETIYMPLTKNKRCDTEDGDKEFMYGIAALAGVCVRSVYEILDFLRTIGLMEHTGYETHPNKDEHIIRISKRCITDEVRIRLLKMSEISLPWRDRYHEKKKAKGRTKDKDTEGPAPPRPPLFRAGMPAHISETVSAMAQEINEALKSTRERTAAETFDLLQAYGRAIMPQGP